MTGDDWYKKTGYKRARNLLEEEKEKKKKPIQTWYDKTGYKPAPKRTSPPKKTEPKLNKKPDKIPSGYVWVESTGTLVKKEDLDKAGLDLIARKKFNVPYEKLPNQQMRDIVQNLYMGSVYRKAIQRDISDSTLSPTDWTMRYGLPVSGRPIQTYRIVEKTNAPTSSVPNGNKNPTGSPNKEGGGSKSSLPPLITATNPGSYPTQQPKMMLKAYNENTGLITKPLYDYSLQFIPEKEPPKDTLGQVSYGVRKTLVGMLQFPTDLEFSLRDIWNKRGQLKQRIEQHKDPFYSTQAFVNYDLHPRTKQTAEATIVSSTALISPGAFVVASGVHSYVSDPKAWEKRPVEQIASLTTGYAMVKTGHVIGGKTAKAVESKISSVVDKAPTTSKVAGKLAIKPSGIEAIGIIKAEKQFFKGITLEETAPYSSKYSIPTIEGRKMTISGTTLKETGTLKLKIFNKEINLGTTKPAEFYFEATTDWVGKKKTYFKGALEERNTLSTVKTIEAGTGKVEFSTVMDTTKSFPIDVELADINIKSGKLVEFHKFTRGSKGYKTFIELSDRGAFTEGVFEFVDYGSIKPIKIEEVKISDIFKPNNKNKAPVLIETDLKDIKIPKKEGGSKTMKSIYQEEKKNPTTNSQGKARVITEVKNLDIPKVDIKEVLITKTMPKIKPSLKIDVKPAIEVITKSITIPKISIKTEQAVKQIVKTKVDTKDIVKPKVEPKQTTETKTEVIPRIDQKIKNDIKNIIEPRTPIIHPAKTIAITEPKIKPPGLPKIINPTPEPKFKTDMKMPPLPRIPLPDLDIGKWEPLKRGSLKSKKEYKPSLDAVVFGITSSKPVKTITGFETRPIVLKERKRNNNNKKKRR